MVSLHYNDFMTDSQKTSKPVCPECDTPLNPPDILSVGKILECPTCGTQSEAVRLDPLKLAPLEEEK